MNLYQQWRELPCYTALPGLSMVNVFFLHSFWRVCNDNTCMDHLYTFLFLFSCPVMFNSCKPWTVAHQAPVSMGFSRQEYCSVQFSSVTQLYLTLCNPMDSSTPGFPVYHQLLEPTQTHVHHVSDAIQPSHPLSSPSPPSFNLSQYQGLFQ